MKSIKRIFEIAGIYASIMLGAGFLSGQEIMQFFVSYKDIGFIGLLLAAILFGIVGWATLEICYTNKIKNYNEFVDVVIGKKVGTIIEFLVILFMFTLFSVMLAGSGASIQQAFFLPYWVGVIIVSIFSFFIFLKGMESVLWINAIMSPFMIIGGVFVAMYSFLNETNLVFLNSTSSINLLNIKWLASSISYVSYNVITSICILSSMNKKIISKNVAKFGGILGGIFIATLGFSIALPLYLNYAEVSNYQIPILSLVHKYNIAIEYFYFLVLIIAIFTSAVANGYSVINWITLKFNLNETIVQIFIIILAICFSYIGFSNLVGIVYPIFGIVGFIEIIFILKKFMLKK